jgi:outer membrane protein TolC
MPDRPLPPGPNATELVSYALRHSPVVEAAYWKFRAAIEAIPQAGTEMTTPMLSGNLALNNGAVSAANSSIGIANMGSSDIRWPAKPAADAKIALENARNAQWRFREAQFDLRRQVLQAWYGLITARALLRNARFQLAAERALEQDQRQHIEFATGAATGYLSAQNAVTRLKITIAQLHRSAASRLANLNLLLNRTPHRGIRTPSSLAFTNGRIPSTAQLIEMAMKHNPNLQALHFTRQSQQITIERATMQYIPNFDLGAMSSLDGAMQNLTGAVMFPVVRYRAINAAIRQAEFGLFRTTSRTHQSRNQVVARLTDDTIAMHSDARQLAYIRKELLPRLHDLRHFSSIALSQESGGLTAYLLATLSILHTRQLELSLQLDFANRQADIDALTAQPIRNKAGAAPAPPVIRH